jgi:hypothetical protein
METAPGLGTGNFALGKYTINSIIFNAQKELNVIITQSMEKIIGQRKRYW